MDPNIGPGVHAKSVNLSCPQGICSKAWYLCHVSAGKPGPKRIVQLGSQMIRLIRNRTGAAQFMLELSLG